MHTVKEFHNTEIKDNWDEWSHEPVRVIFFVLYGLFPLAVVFLGPICYGDTFTLAKSQEVLTNLFKIPSISMALAKILANCTDSGRRAGDRTANHRGMIGGPGIAMMMIFISLVKLSS